jgi:mRNA interferase HigB
MGTTGTVRVRVISRARLREFWERHPQAEGPLKAWFQEAEAADWLTTTDIRKRYPSADFLKDNRVVFNIGGNKYRLVVLIKYEYHLIYIRFVGTHTEYNVIDAARV